MRRVEKGGSSMSTCPKPGSESCCCEVWRTAGLWWEQALNFCRATGVASLESARATLLCSEAEWQVRQVLHNGAPPCAFVARLRLLT